MQIESQAGYVSSSLPEQTVYVNESILYNLETESAAWVKAKLIGISCVPGNVPVFTVLVNGSFVFSDIPPHYLCLTLEQDGPLLSLTDLVYSNCPSGRYALQSFQSLLSREAHVWFKQAGLVIPGQYWFTVDFFEDNGLFHVIKLENGQLACMPSHKIWFGDLPDSYSGEGPLPFPPYLKLRKTFQV